MEALTLEQALDLLLHRANVIVELNDRLKAEKRYTDDCYRQLNATKTKLADAEAELAVLRARLAEKENLRDQADPHLARPTVGSKV